MITRSYDAIVVGARCAGSPTAMLLARKGYRVLLVDRASFPSDTMSTHVVQPLAAAALARWSLLDRLVSTGCPPIDKYTYDFGPFTLQGRPGNDGAPYAYCPRRTILDKLLIDAASEAGVEVRENFKMDQVIVEDGLVTGIKGYSSAGQPVSERAAIVIGADGRNSLVAQTVQPERYNEKTPLLAPYYAYWSGVPMNARFETYIRPHRGFAAAPTHDGWTMVVGGWPYTELGAHKDDVEGNFMKLFDFAPEFAERLRAGKRETRIAGAPTPNFFRKPYGAGWALVGDAGYLKDPITAQGILDAFRDAESCANAVDQIFSGARSFNDAMNEYQRNRDDKVIAMYEFTCQLASLEPPPPDMQQLFGAISGNQDGMDGFAQMNAGTISPADFFAPGNLAGIIGAGPP